MNMINKLERIKSTIAVGFKNKFEDYNQAANLINDFEGTELQDALEILDVTNLVNKRKISNLRPIEHAGLIIERIENAITIRTADKNVEVMVKYVKSKNNEPRLIVVPFNGFVIDNVYNEKYERTIGKVKEVKNENNNK